MADFRKLAVWHRAHALSINVSRATGKIRWRGYGSLRNQMVRSSFSIPANIVEGRALKGGREFARFIGYAIASSSELEYHLLSAHDLGLMAPDDYDSLNSQLVEVRKMLFGLLRRLRSE